MKKGKPYIIDTSVPVESMPALFYSMFDTGYGVCLAATTDRGVCGVFFGDTKKEVLEQLHEKWPHMQKTLTHGSLHEEVKNSVAGKTPASRITLHLEGTPFQRSVWETLLTSSRGDTTNYGAIALRLGDKNAARAVGNAVGKNPIAYIIPCHRVVRATGALGGYRWGVARKKAMLEDEKTRTCEY